MDAAKRALNERNPVRALEHGAFVVLPALLTVWVLHFVWARQYEGADFHRQFWVAGLRVLRGLSPYTLTKARIAAGMAFPYPAEAALLFAPFALLQRSLSGTVFTLLCFASPLVALRVLPVKDWRLYGMALLLGPIVSGWQTANLTLPLMLGIALVWRYRDRPMACGLLVAVIISLKVFVWPIGLWLIATRRHAASVYALVCGIILNAVAWAVIGFGQIRPFLRMSSFVTDMWHRSGYGLIAFAMHLGTSLGEATALTIAVSVSLALACITAGRRRRDQPSLLLAVALMLAASPLVWNHYFALLAVPLAIARPRLSPLWALQLVLWLCPVTDPVTWQRVVALTVVAATTCILLRRPAPATAFAPPAREAGRKRRGFRRFSPTLLRSAPIIVSQRQLTVGRAYELDKKPAATTPARTGRESSPPHGCAARSGKGR